MIIRCPSCTTPLDHQAFDLHRGGLIRCSSCGHDWFEGKAVEVLVEPAPPIPSSPRHSAVPDVDVQQLVSASLLAQEAFQLRRKRRRAAAAAWIGLVMFALSPAAVAITVPERVVAAAPAAIGIYDWLGREVNIYGLEIRKVEMQHLQVGGQRIIAIKGELLNVSGSDRRIPWLRFGLKSIEQKEVYQWQLDTESRPLRPGESKSFVTRIASPPEAASTVEIRFARAEEISSNATP
jgi:hypothetical protein